MDAKHSHEITLGSNRVYLWGTIADVVEYFSPGLPGLAARATAVGQWKLVHEGRDVGSARRLGAA